VCGYAVDYLRSCYRSRWQLAPPPAPPVDGGYYRSPAGTPVYPGLHLVGSLNWTNDEREPPPTLGELSGGKRPYSKGAPLVTPPPPILVGSAECVQSGDRFPPPVVPRTIVGGLDSRCWTQQGLTPPPPPVPPPSYWYRSDDLSGSADGVAVANWPDATGLGRNMLQLNPGLQPLLVNVGGQPVALAFTGAKVLAPPAGQSLGTEHSIYLVGSFGPTFPTHLCGPSVFGGQGASLTGIPDTSDTQMRYRANSALAVWSYGVSLASTQLWSVRRLLGSVELAVYKVGGAVVALSDAGPIPFVGAGASQTGLVSSRAAGLLEVMLYPYYLDDGSHNSVLSYLAARHNL
jgi:hypothetical protein